MDICDGPSRFGRLFDIWQDVYRVFAMNHATSVTACFIIKTSQRADYTILSGPSQSRHARGTETHRSLHTNKRLQVRRRREDLKTFSVDSSDVLKDNYPLTSIALAIIRRLTICAVVFLARLLPTPPGRTEKQRLISGEVEMCTASCVLLRCFGFNTC